MSWAPKAVEFDEITLLYRSRSFKVTDFFTSRKPMWDFLLVININLLPILHHFQVMVDYWSNLFFLWEFRQLYNFSAVGDEDELITF